MNTCDSFASSKIERTGVLKLYRKREVAVKEARAEGRSGRVTDTLRLNATRLTFTILVHCTRLPPPRAAQANYKTGLLSFSRSESCAGMGGQEGRLQSYATPQLLTNSQSAMGLGKLVPR